MRCSRLCPILASPPREPQQIQDLKGEKNGSFSETKIGMVYSEGKIIHEAFKMSSAAGNLSGKYTFYSF